MPDEFIDIPAICVVNSRRGTPMLACTNTDDLARDGCCDESSDPKPETDLDENAQIFQSSRDVPNVRPCHGRSSISCPGCARYRMIVRISPAPANIVNRNFRAAAPNEKWLTDITEFQLPAGKVYLSPVIDCFDGMVVSWAIGTRADADFVNSMLDAAIETVEPGNARPIVHSDRSAHYRWPGRLSRIADAKLGRSMSRKGYSPDNAACEGFFDRLQSELFYPRN